VQFAIYIKSVLQGDLGTSLLTANPVLEDIKRVVPATLELSTVATVIGVVLGIPMGVIAAVHAGRWPDHIVRLIGLFGYSMPVFWLGLMGLRPHRCWAIIPWPISAARKPFSPGRGWAFTSQMP